MNRRAIQLILVAALVAIAGCAGGMGGKPADDPTTDDAPETIDSSGATGTAAFYVSDEPSQIDNFRHLNVTITKVGFKKTGSADVSGESGENESDDGTEDEDESADGAESANETSADETETDDGTGTETESEAGEETDSDGERTDEEEKEGETDADGDGGASEERWVEYDVDERTVDLTELKGANASMIDEFDLPAGEYETVFIYVDDTNGVLTDGSETNVKLPSNKLQLQTTFTIGDDESVDFVYDIAPHKAGRSGQYILKPVISQSGTGDDVEIRDIDEENEAGEKGAKTGEKRTDEETEDGETDDADGNGDAKPEEKPTQN
ncbi:DUF4382 domain-containing protein [Natrinema caseinilyticum]|uniref:DUF4382 domain-containing protein n=1 Tax=Natrinema caseinilyticum TaxID=2961570 RepID=UPI0020C21E89|nr:DUF4382 domain-containing protein [Natrinema caseinilyticum]